MGQPNMENVSEEQMEYLMVYAVKVLAEDMKGRSIKFNADGTVSVFEVGETVSTTYRSLMAYLDIINAQQEALDDTTVKH